MTRIERWFGRGSDPRRQRKQAALQLESLEERRVPTVTYHGGALLTHVEAQSIFFGNQWNSSPYTSQSKTLDGFVKYAVSSSFMDGLTRAGYGVGEGTDKLGVIVSTKLSNGSTLDDTVIQQDIQSLINSKTDQNPDANSLYFFFVQPNIIVSQGGQNSVNDFLGYHGAYSGKDLSGHTLDVNYAVLPYPGGTVGNAGVSGLNAIDDITSTTAHELAEAVTDPSVNTVGWYDDSQNGEIGDITGDSYGRQNGYLFQLVANKNDQPIPLGGFTTLPKSVTTLTSSASTVKAGKPVTFTINVGPAQGSTLPTGQVELLDGDVIIGTLTLKVVNGQEIATFTTTHLSKGTHNLTAVYNGNSAFRESFSASISLVVN